MKLRKWSSTGNAILFSEGICDVYDQCWFCEPANTLMSANPKLSADPSVRLANFLSERIDREYFRPCGPYDICCNY